MQDNLCPLKTNKKTKQKQNRFYKGKFISRTAVTYLVNCAGQSFVFNCFKHRVRPSDCTTYSLSFLQVLLI